MNREVLIEAITREVYRQLQEQGESDPTLHQGCIFMVNMNPDMRVQEVERLCAIAKRQKKYGVCLPQWFVGKAKEELEGTNLMTAPVVGLPGGGTSTPAKYAEIKQAVKEGAKAVFVPVNMEFCTRGMVPEARKDLAQCLTAAKGKASTAALLEVKDLSMGRIEEMAEACIGGGADLVMLSCVTGGSVRLDSVRKLKERGIRVGVYGGTSQPGRLEEFCQAGADWVTAVYR